MSTFYKTSRKRIVNRYVRPLPASTSGSQIAMALPAQGAELLMQIGRTTRIPH